MAWKIYDEPVEMVQRRFQYFPRLFRGRGQRFVVESVQRVWSVTGRRWPRHGGRHFFQVQCAAGDFELFQEAQTGIWVLRRARLAPSRIPAVREAAPAWR
jgi:hypothetical protein